MKNRTLFLALSAPMWIAPLAAHAAPEMTPWTELVLQADENGDGGLSLEEIDRYRNHGALIGFHPFMSKHFTEFDSDGDHKVNMAEIKSGTMKMGMTDADVSQGFNRGFKWDAAPN